MIRRLLAVVLVIATFHPVLAFANEPLSEARWVALDSSPAGTAPRYTVLESDESKTLFEVSLPGFWISPI